MYTSFNREVHNAESVPKTKYTEYLKTLDGAADNYYRGAAGKIRDHTNKTPFLPISDQEVKFSKIFSPHESNALKLQLLQKSSSLPVIDNARSNTNGVVSDSSSNGVDGAEGLIGPDNNASVVGRNNRRRRSTASGLVHANNTNAAARKADSVANILYTTIRHGHDYDNPSADETLHTGSDSKVDYDPHEPLPAVDQIALRHELLNNIRAISRATYFEDLYTGKVRRNSTSPETEILKILENPQEAANDVETANTIPSKEAQFSRVDRWVKESSEASRDQDHNDTDDDKDKHVLDGQDANTSLYHASVWNGNHSERKPIPKPKTKGHRRPKKGDSETSDGSYAESDVETASAYMRRTQPKFVKTDKAVSTNNATNNPPSIKVFTKNTDKTSYNNIVESKSNIPHGAIVSSKPQYVQAKYLGVHDSDLGGIGNNKKRPFSFGYDGSDNLVPLSISLPNVAQNSFRSTPVAAVPPASISVAQKAHSVSRPENLNQPTTYNSRRFDRTKKRETNTDNPEQVRRLAHHQAAVEERLRRGVDGPRGAVRQRQDHKVPGIYSRLNANGSKWTMKKVWFYVNGDDHVPRFECRFRHGKDIRDMDQLLDLLTKRFPALRTGARYIFTMDGYPISSIEEILHENSYVVSSTRKFKAIKYGQTKQDNEASSPSPDIKMDPSHYLGKTNYGDTLNYGTKGQRSINNKTHPRLNRKLSASDGSLNTRMRNSNPNLHVSSDFQRSLSSLNGKYGSDVPKVVAHVIHEASTPSPLARQPIRVINGVTPSLQSQVLLNTKTSQPFEDLVRDLAMSVRIPKQPLGNQLQTLAGRQIRSYSQLRSELRAGQRAFFIYSEEGPGRRPYAGSNLGVPTSRLNPPPAHRNNVSRKPIAKSVLGKVDSNSSSDLSVIAPSRQKERKRQQSRHPSRSPTPSPSPRNMSRLSNSHSPAFSPTH